MPKITGPRTGASLPAQSTDAAGSISKTESVVKSESVEKAKDLSATALSDQTKSRRKQDKQFSGVMKQAAFKEALSKQKNVSQSDAAHSNPYLSGDSLSVFTSAMQNLANVTRQAKMAESQRQIEQLNLIKNMASDTAEQIKRAAEHEAQLHQMLAIESFASIGVTVSTSAMSIASARRKSPEKEDSELKPQSATGGAMEIAIDGASKLQSAELATKAAELEASVKSLDAQQKTVQQTLNNAAKSMKDAQDQIAESLDTMRKLASQVSDINTLFRG